MIAVASGSLVCLADASLQQAGQRICTAVTPTGDQLHCWLVCVLRLGRQYTGVRAILGWHYPRNSTYCVSRRRDCFTLADYPTRLCMAGTVIQLQHLCSKIFTIG